jgi:hypothetical protein
LRPKRPIITIRMARPLYPTTQIGAKAGTLAPTIA